MNAQQLVQLVTDGLLLAIFVVVAIRAIRRRTAGDLDVALLFFAITGVISIGPAAQALGLTPMPLALSDALLVLLLAIPALTLRAIRGFARLHRRAMSIAVAIWLLSSLLLVGSGALSVPLLLAVIAGFVVVEAYGGVMVLRETRRTRGVARHRLEAIALGTLFVGATLLALGVAIVAPGTPSVVAVLTLCVALSYFIGFATPAFVRSAWLEHELRRFMSASAALAREVSGDRVLHELAVCVRESTGAEEAAVGIWDDAEAGLMRYSFSGGETLPHSYAGRPHDWNKPQIRRLHEESFVRAVPRMRALDLQYAALAPIGEHARLGVLGIFAAHRSILLDDDAALLRVLADHVVVVLDQRRLVDQVSVLNADLERRLEQVRSVNEELSAFAYAVSHDLRGPLRGIDGFTQVLLEDKSDALGDDGRTLLARVRNAAGRMNALIDDLLELSRTTRQEMELREVDLGLLVREIWGELVEREPERPISLEVSGDGSAYGDPRLLRVALTNLIGNAWKFTRGRPHAHVAVAFRPRDEDLVVELHDDGVGFDMRYVDKLFAPFQRLHTVAEFEGTGVGLAIVQRIAHRHGGRVSAESEMGQGATFTLTLPREAARPVG